MTILLGFTTKTRFITGEEAVSIQFASDSRITVGTEVQNDARKIVEVMHPDGTCLLAKAGFKIPSDRFEEIFSERLATLEVTGPRSIATAAENAIRELAGQLLDRAPEPNQERLSAHHCAFLLGYFFDRKPYIFYIDLWGRIAAQSKGDYIATGSAESLANFLLGSMEFEGLDTFRGSRAAVCLVEMCKLGDSACGGPVQFGGLMRDRDKHGASYLSGATSPYVLDGKTDRQKRRLLMKAFSDDFWLPSEIKARKEREKEKE